MKFDHDGKTYEFLDSHMTVPACRDVKRYAGLSLTKWAQGLRPDALDVDALVAMVFTAKRRAGEQVLWSDLDGLDLMALVNSIERHLKEQLAERAAAAESAAESAAEPAKARGKRARPAKESPAA